MLDFIKKYQSSIGYSLLLIAAISIYVFRIVYRNVGFNTLYDEAYFLFKLSDAYNGIIAGDTQWNFITIHLFPYLNLYDKADAYLANILLHIASVVVITTATCYKKNGETWLKYSALYSTVYTLSVHVNQELTYVSLMVFFLTLIVSLCLILRRCEKRLEIALCCVVIGFVVPWTFLSILPSGALILLSIFILLLIYYWGEWDKFGISVASGISGIFIGLIFIHFFIINLGDTFAAMQVTASYISTTHRGYDPLSFVKQILVVGKGWILTIVICSILYTITLLFNKVNHKWLTIIGGCAYVIAVLAFYIYHPYIKTTEALLFSTIGILPILFHFKLIKEKIQKKDFVIYCLLLAFPVIASMGTNVYLGQRMGCFMFTYVILIMLLSDKLAIRKEVAIVAILVLLAPSYKMMYETLSHKDAMVYYQNMDSPISNILLEPSQAEYFERIDSILTANQIDKNLDYALAVNEDYATLYTLNIRNRIMPYGAEDIIYTTKYDSIIPQCIFIAKWEVDMVVEQTNNKWRMWGFPKDYEVYKVGSPDAYRGGDTDRLLYIKKDRNFK